MSCSGRCLIGAYADIQIGRSKQLLTQYSNVYLLRNAGRKTIRIGFDGQTLTKLRSALAHARDGHRDVYGAILDPSGDDRARRPLRVRLKLNS